MGYKVEYDKRLLKSISKLDKKAKEQIKKYIDDNLVDTENPYNAQWRGLKGNLKNKGRYRVGNYRILAEIKENRIIIYILDVGHRKEIYK